MGKRHEAIGVRQAIRLVWMQKTANLMLAGLDPGSIRRELHELLAASKADGTEVKRSDETRRFAVNSLMKIWVTPDPELVPFRDASLAFLRENPAMNLPVHWAMISAVYPFWFNAARQTGRLLGLQDQVVQQQIITRLKEQYGDRQSVSRYGRFVIRAFIDWGVLKDSATKGCYEKSPPGSVFGPDLIALMVESALLASPDAKGALSLLINSPAFFPFQVPVMTGNLLSQHNERIEVVRYGLNDELLKLK
jgi:hypothetical protein